VILKLVCLFYQNKYNIEFRVFAIGFLAKKTHWFGYKKFLSFGYGYGFGYKNFLGFGCKRLCTAQE